MSALSHRWQPLFFQSVSNCHKSHMAETLPKRVSLRCTVSIEALSFLYTGVYIGEAYFKSDRIRAL